MNSSERGSSTSSVEVLDISPNGIWMLCHDEELFLPYDDFPWFRDQPASRIRNVRELRPAHLYWPDMDVDLSVESIRHPEKFPLKARS